MKAILLFAMMLLACGKEHTIERYPFGPNGSKFQTGKIASLEGACAYETSTSYKSCFIIACDKGLDRIIYVSYEGIVTITSHKCSERK